MIRGPRPLALVGALVVMALPSCAWSNEDNRPVWNAFEENLVPNGGGVFVAALPVTVPLGIGAIAVDTIIAHPLQVVGDAYDDAAQLWDQEDFEFAEAYYTEMAGLPLRAIASPALFTLSFLGRSIFDIRAPLRMTEEQRVARDVARQQEAELAQRAAFRDWLAGVPNAYVSELLAWHPSFDAPVQRAMAGDARERLRLHEGMLRLRITHMGNYDATAGLRDPDPVVRYTCVKAWPRSRPQPPAELVEALRNDPVASIRLLAEDRFGGAR